MTKKQKTKIKVFTHNDLDGAVPVIMLKSLFDCEVHYKMCHYGNVDSRILDFFLSDEYKKYSLIFITDISIKKEVAEIIDRKIKEEQIYVRLIDHHNNDKVEHLKETYKWCVINYDISASKLFLDFIKKSYKFDSQQFFELPLLEEMVELTDEWDTWEWTKTNNYRAVNLNDLMYQYGKIKFIEKFTERIKQSMKDKSTKLFDNFDSSLLEIVSDHKSTYMSGKLKDMQIFPATFKGVDFNIGLVYSEQYTSELAEYLFRNSETPIHLVQMVNLSTGSVSVRTKTGEINANEIAQLHDGNGHPASAGYRLTDEVMEKVYDITCCL